MCLLWSKFLIYPLSQVTSLASYLEPMSEGSVGCASKTMNSRQQMNILDQSKTAAEAAAQLIVTAKEAGGNPKVC